MVAVGRGNAVFDRSAASDQRLFHVADCLADDRPCLQLIKRPEADEPGVGGVGFGAPAGGLGQAPGPQRVDLDGGQPGLAELAFKAVIVGAGRLNNDAQLTGD